MNLANLIAFVIFSCYCLTRIHANDLTESKCVQPSSSQFRKCKIPPALADLATSKPNLNKDYYCERNINFIKCMSKVLSKVCDDSDSPRVVYFLETVRKEIGLYNETYEQFCSTSDDRTTPPVKEITKECSDPSIYKCQSRSLYRTCGYPAANPKSNLNAYCNEMRAYLICAKCKTSICKLRGNTIHIQKQEKNYRKRCASVHSNIITSKITTIPTTILATTISTTSTTTTSTVQMTTTTTATTSTTATTTSTTTTIKTTLSIESILDQISFGSTISNNQINLNKKKVSENHLKQTTALTTLRPSTTSTPTTTTTTLKPKPPVTISSHLQTVKPININKLLITFDFINIIDNTLTVKTSNESVNFNMKIFNKTDIFKGIKNGAIHLHRKANFNLDLKRNKKDFCLTSQSLKGFNKTDITCSKGWTVSFWIKIFNKINFDKTIIQIDNTLHNKYLSFRLSNNIIKVQCLLNHKLWEINQQFTWKSEWTMFTLSWTEFEGLSVFVNDKLFSNEQSFEYYSPLAATRNRFSFNTRREFDYSNIQGDGSSNILVGLNNEVEMVNSKLKEESFSESILIDELEINNYRLSVKEISEYYLKNYFIKNQFGKDNENMFLITLDNKRSSVVLARKAAVTKQADDSLYLNLNGLDSNFAIASDTFDSCIIDSDSLCSFGFTVTTWVKFTLDQLHLDNIEKGFKKFEQILFYTGAHNLDNGLEVLFYILPTVQKKVFNYMIKVNYKVNKSILSRNFQINIDDTSLLNNLNCLIVQYTRTRGLELTWPGFTVKELDTQFSKDLKLQSSYQMSEQKVSKSSSIAIFGDFEQTSSFKIKHFEIKNYAKKVSDILSEFQQENPSVSYKFDHFEGSVKKNIISMIASPQIVETRYGKSMLFSKTNQMVILANKDQNESKTCFHDLNKCSNGYTLKMWLCFTNYNLLKQTQNKQVTKNEPSTKIIYILTKKDMQVIYDVDSTILTVFLKDSTKIYIANINFSLKLYMWYVLTVTWHSKDGLRVYVNNKLLDHIHGVTYEQKTPANNVRDLEFTLGRDIGMTNLIDSLNGRQENQPLTNRTLNNYYEFIVHKIVQFNARKYPDEIIATNNAFQAQNQSKTEALSITWIWYSLAASFLLITAIVMISFVLIVKHRSKNGFWSREDDVKTNKPSSSFKCFSIFNSESSNDFLEQNKKSHSLQLKKCNAVAEDRYLGPISIDEYLTNSLYGTINRLITTQKNACLSMNSCETAHTTTTSRNIEASVIRSSTSYILPDNEDDNGSGEIHF